MKKLIVFLILILTSITYSQDKYKKLWLKVEDLEIKDLPKSASKEVDIIYNKAKREHNSQQLIKTLFYKSKFMLILEEDAQLKVISQFKKQISESSFPEKNMLENVLANLYWQYFNQHRWQFYSRTKTAKKVDKTDFRTWDLQTLFKETHLYFDKSLQNEEELQKINIEKYSEILKTVKQTKEIHPTLYDFLAHNALFFYKTDETHLTKPAYQFKIDNPEFIADAQRFIALNISTKDNFSLQFNALKIYQKLINFHLQNNNLKAFATIDLERLQFIKQHKVFENADELYLNTLKFTEKKYQNNDISGLYAYKIANIYNNQANSRDEKFKEKYKRKNNEALEICEKVILKFPKSRGTEQCKALKKVIKNSTVSLVTEKITPINKHSRALVNYKNVDKLYFTAYKINANHKMYKGTYRYNSKQCIKLISNLKSVKKWENKLRNEHDYQQHSTEVIIPKLNNGRYLIVASTSPKLSEKNIFGFSSTQVTNLTFIQINTQKYQILNRITGVPIANVKVHLENKPTRYNPKINKTLITDNNGFISVNTLKQHHDVKATVSTKNDIAIFSDIYISKERKHRNYSDNLHIKPFIFTDRSIYRPSQTVYFKAILVAKENYKSRPFIEKDVIATLYDVNRKKIKSLTLKTNEFGSISGEFILPNSGLTGQYQIEIRGRNFDYSRHKISVEEYKRPKFEVKFKPVTETYKVNDKITINGFAKAFSGANITDAKVSYRIYREARYPRWCYWRRPSASSPPQEIKSGELTTDDQGKFNIKFNALVDKNINKKDLPVFTYKITAEVTDINGETHKETTSVNVGYHALIATVSAAKEMDKNEENQLLKIDTKNLNGEFVPAKGTVKIYKLQAPKSPLRKRPWNIPDYQDIPEEEFRKKFPFDAYSEEENNKLKWKKGKLVFEDNFNTSKEKEIKLSNTKNWESGKYIAVLTSKDRFKQKVKDEVQFKIFSNNENKVADNSLFFIQQNKERYLAGENVKLRAGTALKDLTLIIFIEKNHEISSTKIIHLKDKIQTVSLPFTKQDADLGGFAMCYHFVTKNSFYNGSLTFQTKRKIPKLEIETKTFRDKLKPGSKQTWSFTIKNDNKDKATAEVLASMYDASLDAFSINNWSFNPISFRSYSQRFYGSNANLSFKNTGFRFLNLKNPYKLYEANYKAYWKWFGFSLENRWLQRRYIQDLKTERKGISSKKENKDKEIPLAIIESEEMNDEEEESEEAVMTVMKSKKRALKGLVAGVNNSNKLLTNSSLIVEDSIESQEAKIDKKLSKVQARKNLQETAFFYPKLTTDKKGNVSFNFTIPEALTRWKLQLLAHNKQLASATKTLETITQKELMVVPNTPRFIRHNDKITLSAKISNLSDKSLKGTAQLVLTNAITGKSVNLLDNSTKNQSFSVYKNGNTNVSWNLLIPDNLDAVQYKIVAKAGDFSDGEQNALPVLSNRMLVTETLPLWVNSNQSKTFTLDKLKNNKSSTLKHHKLTLEVTSNPAWYAVQALPYLMEYPYECAEQTFSRYYANTLAGHIVNQNPKIKLVFEQWKTSDALISNLEKNQELKSLIIEETPWLRDAQSETEQKKRIALLFDLNQMKNMQVKALSKLQDMQFPDGGFSWFKGARRPNAYISQHIATGFGHLKHLGVKTTENKRMISKLISFLDIHISNRYQQLLKEAKRQKDPKKYLTKKHIYDFELQYLYMRSFYTTKKLPKRTKKAKDYYFNQSEKYWQEFSLYGKGLVALVQFRNGNKPIANSILKSLDENSITSEELGMYWKSNKSGWRWYQAPIETQSLLIEAFSEIKKDTKTIDNLKKWLLKNKQVSRWKTTKATSDAVYALLLQGTDWISVTDLVEVKLGDLEVNPSKIPEIKTEAGTGYFKTSWSGSEIKPKMADVTITSKGKVSSWGGLYWQYFEDLDKITTAETPLKLKKKLFKKVNSETGKKLIEINKKSNLKVGDLLTVRIELRSDRDMEFIFMKDMRASGVEPISVLSTYKWQDGLGYYQSTKDASTNFFFERLPKGVYVFEYDVRVNNAGNFSNGITTIESMYAPEFKSHSEGLRINVK